MNWLSDAFHTVRRALTRQPEVVVPPGHPASVEALVAGLEHIQGSTPAGDGLAAFNGMYLRVSRRVQERVARGGFRDPAYMARLTAVFGGLYLQAVEEAATGRNKAWAPLLESRHARGVLPVQFALAGMNAHINYDLPVAVVRTGRQLGVPLGPAVAADYRAITDLLGEEQEAVRQSFLTGLALEVDRRLTGPAADLVSSWSIARARDAAWTNAQVLWKLQGVDPLHGEFLGALGRSVGMASRLLLTPVAELTR